jgi:hypothetical protein
VETDRGIFAEQRAERPFLGDRHEFESLRFRLVAENYGSIPILTPIQDTRILAMDCDRWRGEKIVKLL